MTHGTTRHIGRRSASSYKLRPILYLRFREKQGASSDTGMLQHEERIDHSNNNNNNNHHD